MPATLPETMIDPDDAWWLIGADAFTDVIHTLQRDHPTMTTEEAERILCEAIKFVATGARFPEYELRPSRIVDLGWHALILHTRTYTQLCEKVGAFVHHNPSTPDSATTRSIAIDRTQVLMIEAGHNPNPTLWAEPGDPTMSDDPGPCCTWCDPTKPKVEQ